MKRLCKDVDITDRGLISKAVYACLNLEAAYCPPELRRQTIRLGGDIGTALRQLCP